MTQGSSATGSAWARLPPTVPRLRMAGCPTCANASTTQRTALRQERRELRLTLAGHGADAQPAAFIADVGQPFHPVEVHQHLGIGQPQVQQRHQALAPGQDTRLSGRLPQESQRFGQGPGRVVTERRRFHNG